MIEFKAECGHTIRAKDEDSGSVVRCSYCGREATVPEAKDDSLDFLFQDIGEGGEDRGERIAKPKGLWAKSIFSRRRHKEFDPFAVVLRLCYAALLIIIVLVVGRMYLLPALEKAELWWDNRQASEDPDLPVIEPEAEGHTERPSARRRGPIAARDEKGLFVTSTPLGASIFYRKLLESDKFPRTASGREPQRIFRDSDTQIYPREKSKVGDGQYVVEVVFPWNHVNLTGFPNYSAFRDRIEATAPKRRHELLTEYFIPDGADEVFVAETPDQIYFVHQYLVDGRRGELRIVRALFLPRIAKREGGDAFSIEMLLPYLPTGRVYEFNERHILNELRHNTVPEPDRQFVLEALSRIGVIPCVTDQKGTLLFKIGVPKGEFLRQRLSENNQ